MAHIEKLKQREGGLDEFLNVDTKVGGDPDCANSQEDVVAVQQLLALILRGTPGVKLGVPAANGTFDAITGFHIFNIQHFVQRRKPGTIVDGCVSPAKGIWYGGGVWCILNLNAMARNNDKTGWEKMMERFR